MEKKKYSIREYIARKLQEAKEKTMEERNEEKLKSAWEEFYLK
jgi:hypothetical protein